MHDPATTLPQSKPVKHPHFAHPSTRGNRENAEVGGALSIRGRMDVCEDVCEDVWQCANYGQQLEKNVVVVRSAVCDALQTR